VETVKPVVAVPWRPDGGRRDQLWSFTRSWIERHHDYPIITADSDPGPFNRGQAVNRAAALGGDWQVLVVHDADTVADPQLVEEAVQTAASLGRVVMPYEVYIYLDKYSSDMLMASDGRFPFIAPIPYTADNRYDGISVIHHGHSGVVVFPRAAFDAVGGFIEFSGWGYEDSVMVELLRVFAGGTVWLRGGALHLWHQHACDQRLAAINLRELQRIRLDRTPQRLRTLLAERGHIVP
jgi:hypothetical protein